MTAPLAVVTGAASGIGSALTQELRSRSVDVIAIDKDPLPFDRVPGITPRQADAYARSRQGHPSHEFGEMP